MPEFNLSSINLEKLNSILIFGLDEEKLLADINEAATPLKNLFPSLDIEQLVLNVQISSLDGIHTQFNFDAKPNLNAIDLTAFNEQVNSDSSVLVLLDLIRAYNELYNINNHAQDEVELISESKLIQQFKDDSIESGQITKELAKYVDWDNASSELYNEYKKIQISIESISEETTFFYKG